MTEEEIKYVIPADSAGHPGSQVDLIVTYDETAPVDTNTFEITGATGTYETIDASGQVIHTDTITGLVAPGGFGGNDNLIGFRDGVTESHAGVRTILDPAGLTFEISDPADSNDGAGHVNLYGVDTFDYGEAGENHGATSDLSFAPVCFVEGTRIRTAQGDVAVEALGVGDDVVTASGQYRRIRWIGRRRLDCRRAADPTLVHPIRIAAGAFGLGKPSRDLMVSPGHAICVPCVDEVLIPAGALANGATIAQVEPDHVTYWHVELDSHDILLAEGLPCESYMDVGNRAFFAGGDGMVDAVADEDLSGYCRPFVSKGALVRAVRERLRARSALLGWQEDDCPHAGLHLIADGCVVEPLVDGRSLTFALSAEAHDVRLASRIAVPSEREDCTDDRRLGVQLRRLRITDANGETRAIEVDHPALVKGVHKIETDGTALFRWTSGATPLPSELWTGFCGNLRLTVELAGASLPSWISTRWTEGVAQPARRQAAPPALVIVGGRAA